MAVYFNNSPSLAALSGQSLGTGLGEGLRTLATENYNQMKARQDALRRAHGLQAILPKDLTPETALAAAYAPDKALQEYVKRKLLQPSQQAYLRLLQQQFGGGEGEGQSGELPADLAEAGVTEQQATKLTELGMKKQEQKAAEQRHYEKLFNKRIESIESEGKAAAKAFNITNRMADVIKKDKAQLGSIITSGGVSKFVPQAWLNKDTQELISLGNDLVLKRAQMGKGVPIKFRLAMEELAKPGIWMKPEVALARIKDIQEELLEDMAESQALEKIQESGIDKHFKKNLASGKKKALEELKKSIEPQTQTFNELPDASKFNGKIAKNSATGQRMKSVNGKWEPVKE